MLHREDRACRRVHGPLSPGCRDPKGYYRMQVRCVCVCARAHVCMYERCMCVCLCVCVCALVVGIPKDIIGCRCGVCVYACARVCVCVKGVKGVKGVSACVVFF